MQKQDRYKILLTILHDVVKLDKPQKLIDKILERAVAFMNAERGYLVLMTSSGELITAAGVENVDSIKKYSSTVVRRVLGSGESVLVHDAMKTPDLSTESIMLESIRSIIAAPLRIRGEIKGVIYLDSTTKTGLFTKNDLELLEAFASIASLALSNATEYQELLESYETLRIDAELKSEFVGQSPKFLEVLSLIKKFAPTKLPVLITGESGTGKELAAKLIHKISGRKGEFVAVNCAAIPKDLLEAELFGYKKGAFTGATESKKGLFEVAHRGTLFLDEIAEMPPELQVKLLRVIQDNEIRPLGGTKSVKVDVRIIAATNRDIRKAIQDGHFREDLFYRLNVLHIHMPPLRERPEDIPILVAHFIKKYGDSKKRIERKALIKLLNYHWPGNVRELENVIARAVVISQGDVIREGDITLEHEGEAGLERKKVEFKSLEEVERQYILDVLEGCGWNKTRAAKILGITLRGLQYKLKRWGIDKSAT